MSVTYTNGKVFLNVHKNASTWIERSLTGILGPDEVYDNKMNASHSPVNSVICFVRNPWDRCLSGYLYSKTAWYHPIHGQVKEHGPFPEYPEYLREVARSGLGCTFWQSFKRQVDYIDVPRSDLFFLGRFETLKEDFNKLLEMMEVKMTKKLPKKNVSRGKSGGPFGYRDYYTEETKKIVENIYSNDCIRFGYEF